MTEKTHASNRRWLNLTGFVLLCVLVQVTAGLLTAMSVKGWYLTIEKPAWTPPGWVFGPVWTYLYISMGVAAWLVWERRRHRSVRSAMLLFGAQLSLNLIWSGLFFGLQMPMLAFWEIVLLWIAILATLISFWRIRVLAGVILVPYLAWVSYASALTLAIWRLNP